MIAQASSAVLGQPSLSWLGPGPDNSLVRHLALSASHTSCCQEGEEEPCPCSLLLPLASLADCDSRVQEACRSHTSRPSLTLFLSLGSRVIIQERDCGIEQ